MGKQRVFDFNNFVTFFGNRNRTSHKLMFMPDLIDLKINSDRDSEIWKNWYPTPSLEVTGKTRQGNAVVVYAHIPNYFSDPENIGKVVMEERLYRGGGIIPEGELYRLLKKEDENKVFVRDLEKFKNSRSGIVSIDSALEHPQTIPFLGGEKRAERYLQKHKQVYGDDVGIGISYNKDLKSDPLGRCLFIGEVPHHGLDGDFSLQQLWSLFRGTKRSNQNN